MSSTDRGARPLGVLSAIVAALAGAVGVAATLFLLTPGVYFREWDGVSGSLAGIEAQETPALDSRTRRLAALSLAAQEDRRLRDRVYGGLTAPVDARACARALVRNVSAGGVREGCSTVPMQVAGFAMDLVAPGGRNLRTKLLQVRLSLGLADQGPETLLRLYLARLPCGTDLTEGLDGCSLLYFGRRPEVLTDAEAVLIATAVQAPSRDLRDPVRARARVERAVTTMVSLGWLDAAEGARIAGEPLRLGELHPDLVRAWSRGQDLGWTEVLRAALDTVPAEPDLVKVAALFAADGRIVAAAGSTAWLDVPMEAGSWIKPWCAEATRAIPGVGEKYLREAAIPVELPLVDRILRRYRPRNLGRALPSVATPGEWLARSVNTATLAAWVGAPLWAPDAERDRWLQRWVTPAEIERWSTPRDWRATARFLAAWTGASVPENRPLPGFRVLSTAAIRSCVARVREDVPAFSAPDGDLAALLGLGTAPLRAWGAGMTTLWLAGGEPTPIARLIADFSADGTLGSLARTVPGGLTAKTATASRSVGLLAMFPTRAEAGAAPVVLLVAAARPSGAPIAPHTSHLLAPVARAVLDSTWPDRARIAQGAP